MSLIFREGKYFSWERQPEALCLSEFLLFFKIKNFEDLKDVCPSYERFIKEQDRIRIILQSFLDWPIIHFDDDPMYPVPIHIKRSYSELYEQVLIEAYEHTKGLVSAEDFDKIENFFRQTFRGDILQKLQYSILTSGGEENISLVFAENFRFKSEKGFFNLFSMPKEERHVIVPYSDSGSIFVSDYRQFEFRTFLNLQGKNEFLKDPSIYDSLGSHLQISSNDAKVGIISSLYGSSKNSKIEEFLDKSSLLDRVKSNVFWADEYPVYIPDDSEEGKSVHTITQTISQYRYIERLSNILDLFNNSKSKFIFPLHDSIIASIEEEEFDLASQIVQSMECDVYKVKCYVGPNFKEIEEV